MQPLGYGSHLASGAPALLLTVSPAPHQGQEEWEDLSPQVRNLRSSVRAGLQLERQLRGEVGVVCFISPCSRNLGVGSANSYFPSAGAVSPAAKGQNFFSLPWESERDWEGHQWSLHGEGSPH